MTARDASDEPRTAAPRTGGAWPSFRDDVQAAVLAALPEHVRRLGWGHEQVARTQRDALRRLLAHAVERSPFHRRRLAGIAADAVGPGDLPRLPVMTKAEMMADFDDVLADRRLRREAVEDALRVTAAEPVPILGDYVAHASGGSSGERGLFVFDRPALSGYLLSLARPLAARLAAAGGAPPGGLPIAMVAAASAVHPTGAAAAQTAGGALPFHFVNVPVTLPLAEIVRRLEERRPLGLFGYASVLARLAAERRAGRLSIAPRLIGATSEGLEPEARAAIAAAFGVPVVDSYASTEGLVGAGAPGGEVIQLNSDLCIAEPVDADDRPVAPGEPSSAVLITNLANLVQPLIRYRLDDALVVEPPVADVGHLRVRVRGRADPPLRYGPVEVHPHVVRSVLLRAPHVVDHQVRQTALGLDVDVVVDGGATVEGLAERLTCTLAEAGLAAPVVAVRTVAELDRHPETGKLVRIVPLPAGHDDRR